MTGWRAAVVLALVQACILVAVARDKSDTVDEGQYLASGATLWANGDTRYLCGAPLLPMRGFGAAMRLVDAGVATVTRAAPLEFVVRSPAAFRRLLFAGRAATIAVTVLAGLLLWRVGRRFGAAAGIAAQALWCFSPTVLGNGALATLDPWAAATAAAVLWAAVRLVERTSLSRAALLGCACGLAAATKITTVAMLPLAGALIVWCARPRAVRVAATLGVTAGAFAVTVWAIYGFGVGEVRLTDPCAPWASGAVGPLPFPAWIESAVYQLRHGRDGHLNYLFGAVSQSGWWWFYLACLAFKVTVGAQALAVLRAASCAGAVLRTASGARASRRTLLVDAALLAYPLLLLGALSAGRHQANIAFLLPAFPFTMLWLARGVAQPPPPRGDAPGDSGPRDPQRERLRVAVFAALLLLGAAESLRIHPHYLMFFNLWAGGSEGGPRYLVHRDDWGQDKRRLGEWQHRHGVDRLFYADYGTNAALWGIVADPVPCTPTIGVYALHAVEVHRPQFSLPPGCVDWLTVEPPDERLGYSIYVYRVDAARLERLRRERASPHPFWRSGGEWRSSTP